MILSAETASQLQTYLFIAIVLATLVAVCIPFESKRK